MEDKDFLRYVDVGAMGGLEEALAVHASRLWPVLFEPNPAEAERVRASMRRYPRHSVIDRALGHVDGVFDFFVARNPTCSSLLPANFDFLENYGISYHFHEEGKEKITLSRYDTLFNEGSVPSPDVIKIDVQGFEYEVLLGFGGLLANVLAIKLETHFYQLYKSQKLFGSIIELLSGFGFVLRKIDTNKLDQFSGDVVEVDAYFSKNRRDIRDMRAEDREKYDLIAGFWDLPIYNFQIP